MWVRARVHRIAAKGKSCFITLRRGFSSIQMVLGNKIVVAFVSIIVRWLTECQRWCVS
jgi:aspartyl/asparaginyl-tRNA synthetase